MGGFGLRLDDCVPEYCRSRVLVLGCGNILFGDDGFGPAVAERLQSQYAVPDNVCILDVGTGVRDVLFTVALSLTRPEKLVIVDTLDTGRNAGEVLVTQLQDRPPTKDGGFSTHQVPTVRLLEALEDCCQLDILAVTVQPERIPETVRPGLSPAVEAIVPEVCRYLLEYCVSTQRGKSWGI